MARTYTDTPEPRYVEKAKVAESTSEEVKISNISTEGSAANQFVGTGADGKMVWKDAPDYTVSSTLISTDGGFQIDYSNGGAIMIPVEGTDDIIVDVDETNHKINIHIDAATRTKIGRALLLPTQAPSEQSVAIVGTNNAQSMMTLTELAAALKPLMPTE